MGFQWIRDISFYTLLQPVDADCIQNCVAHTSKFQVVATIVNMSPIFQTMPFTVNTFMLTPSCYRQGIICHFCVWC